MANSSIPASLQALSVLLDKGEVSPLCDSCCPCGDIYVFASVETYLKFDEAVGWSQYAANCPQGNSFQLNCCTDDCLDKIGGFSGPEVVDIILDKGVIEFSLLGGKSMLCTLYDYLVQEDLKGQAAADAIDLILDKGIVYQCAIDKDKTNGDNSQSIIASVETYLKYAESVNGGDCTTDPCQCLPEPCCFSLKATVETYLKYAEAIGIFGGGGAVPA